MVAIVSCDSYRDQNGNAVEGEILNCKVIFKGKHSVLRIIDGFHAYGERSTIIIEDYCDITLGPKFQLGRQSTMFFRSGSHVTIGAHASLGNQVNIYCRGTIKIADHFCMREFSELRVHGTLTFDSWVYLQHHVVIYVPKYSKLTVGIDTGFSWYSKIIAGSGHSTFDTKHEIKIEELIAGGGQTKHLCLGNHIWVGCGSMIHNDVSIGDGSIVASGSVVLSGAFGANVLISGNPAKVVAEDIHWDRRPSLSYTDYQDYRATGEIEMERPSFFDEYSDQGIFDDYYMKDSYSERFE